MSLTLRPFQRTSGLCCSPSLSAPEAEGARTPEGPPRLSTALVSEHLTLCSPLGLVASHHSADASSETAGRGGQVEHSLSLCGGQRDTGRLRQVHQVLKIPGGAIHAVVVARHDGVCLAVLHQSLDVLPLVASLGSPLD